MGDKYGKNLLVLADKYDTACHSWARRNIFGSKAQQGARLLDKMISLTTNTLSPQWQQPFFFAAFDVTSFLTVGTCLTAATSFFLGTSAGCGTECKADACGM